MLQSICCRPENERTSAIVCLWQWWKERNEVREGGTPRSPAKLSHPIMSRAGEFVRMNAKDKNPRTGECAVWRWPPLNFVKINTDGTYRGNTKQGGWGFVIRDRAGSILQAGAGPAAHLQDAFHAEVIACAAAIKAASERGMSRIELETDSMMLRNAIQDNSFNLSSLGGVILEIKHVILSCFHSFSVSYSPRSCNKVAHELAAYGCNLQTVSSWAGCPPGLERLVSSDSDGLVI